MGQAAVADPTSPLFLWLPGNYADIFGNFLEFVAGADSDNCFVMSERIDPTWKAGRTNDTGSTTSVSRELSAFSAPRAAPIAQHDFQPETY